MLTKLAGSWGIKYDNYHSEMTNDKFTKKTF